jgi:hypothetical protein
MGMERRLLEGEAEEWAAAAGDLPPAGVDLVDAAKGA